MSLLVPPKNEPIVLEDPIFISKKPSEFSLNQAKEVIVANECTEYQFRSPFYPGKSCEGIYMYNKNPEIHDRSGYYWITNGPTRVYCGMTYTGSSCEYIYMTAIAADSFIPICAGVYVCLQHYVVNTWIS